jgi:hypothetical protein
LGKGGCLANKKIAGAGFYLYDEIKPPEYETATFIVHT